MKLNLGCGPHRLVGFENLDKDTGWLFEHGLSLYDDASVEAITISHALMYVPLGEWLAVFAEFYRVLEPAGVVRITEDATDDPDSERFGGAHDAVTLTTLDLVAEHLAAAGLEIYAPAWGKTWFRDDSLIQQLHGLPPKVFAIEGIKP